MKHVLTISVLAVLLSGTLWVTGCSSSEESATTIPPAEEQGTEQQNLPTTDVPADVSDAPVDTPTTDPTPVTPVPEPQVTKPPETQPSEKTKTGIMMWSVQIGAFKNEAGAMQLLNEAKSKLQFPVYKDYDPVSGLYKVSVGSFQTRDQAGKFKTDVQAQGYPDAFVVEVRR